MITILGLSMVAIPRRPRCALKGVAAAGLGLIIGTIGFGDERRRQPAHGSRRLGRARRAGLAVCALTAIWEMG